MIVNGESDKRLVLYFNQEVASVDKDRKNITENVALGASITGGAAATAAGVMATGTAATGTISAVGATIGGVTGGVIGSGVGLATGGVGMVATVPFAAAGAAIGGWAGPALAAVGIGTATAPVWAVPVAIGGAIVALGGAARAVYKYGKSRAEKA